MLTASVTISLIAFYMILFIVRSHLRLETVDGQVVVIETPTPSSRYSADPATGRATPQVRGRRGHPSGRHSRSTSKAMVTEMATGSRFEFESEQKDPV